jgi:hypothetical protein
MMKARLAAALLAASLGVGHAACKKKPPAAPTAPQNGPRLDEFEKQVLFNLDALAKLKGPPSVPAFIKELDAEPGLRAGLSGGLDVVTIGRFKTLVAKYAGKPGFREAALDPEKAGGQPPADSCGEKPKPLIPAEKKPVLDNSAPADGSCADGQGAGPLPLSP